MGVGEQIACFTCKTSYYLGYGSYGTWFYATSLAEWQRCAEHQPEHATLRKNQNLLSVLIEHDGHDLRQWPDDYEYGVEGDTLYAMGPWATRGDPIIPALSAFTHVNLDDREAIYGPLAPVTVTVEQPIHLAWRCKLPKGHDGPCEDA